MTEDQILARAERILRARCTVGDYLTSPAAVRAYLTTKLAKLATRDREHFGCVFLNAQNAVICEEELFAGTLTQASVYPREIARRALINNAAAVILYHNHPSGLPEPSHADELLTIAIRNSLKLFDVLVLDHIIVGGAKSVSFAERGLV